MKTNQPLIVLLGLIGVFSAWSIQEKVLKNHSKEQVIVTPAPVTSVVALGRIKPEGEVIKLSVANAQDSRLNQILVKEGHFVKANQVIAILQGIERREADLRGALADVRLRQAELAKVQQGDTKKSQLARQRAAITRLEAQLLAETKQKKAAAASVQATLTEAQLNFQRRQTLASEGAISRADADVARRDFETAKATLEERKADIEQTVTTLQAEITQERARLAELQEVPLVDIEIARAHLEKAKIAVEQKKAELEDAKVRVPVAGQILKINTRVGEQVNTNEGIVELARTNQMFAIAEVAESDISKVRQGQQATITSEYGGFTGEVRGTVQDIGLQVGQQMLQDAANNGPTTDQNARSVAVKVRIDLKDSPKVAALTNMQVRVKLDIATNNSVVAQAQSSPVVTSTQAFQTVNSN